MHRPPTRSRLAFATAAALSAFALFAGVPALGAQPRISITRPAAIPATLDGRLLLYVSTDTTGNPRSQVNDGAGTAQVFGMDVTSWRAGTPQTIDAAAFGYPVQSLRDLKPGRYRIQALFNRYERFTRSDGHTVLLPPDRGEGQQMNAKPGNLFSKPVTVTVAANARLQLELTEEIPALPDPATKQTKYVKYVRIRSERLSKFWGTDFFLAAWVLLPEGFDSHPDARYPLVVNQGHFPATLSGWRETPPDPDLAPDYSARFSLAGYNRIQQELGYQLYKDWTAAGFPRALMIEIQHPTPYYDDSYGVNSANNGPYGDAIMYELIPEIEKRYRGLGAGWARFNFGGSTGGWESMAVQMFYPDEFNGAWIACPDPIDFRHFTVVDIYKDRNAYYDEGPFKRVPRPGSF